MTRPHTPPRPAPGGGTRVTVQRYCNGCDGHIGDATLAELNAAIADQDLPDVRGECPTCNGTGTA